MNIICIFWKGVINVFVPSEKNIDIIENGWNILNNVWIVNSAAHPVPQTDAKRC